MKKHKIKIIVAVMATSVTALIALQVYWISNLVKIEEERFERTVNNSLLNVTAKLEKGEAANAVVKKITGGKDDVVVVVKSGTPHNFNFHFADSLKPFQVKSRDSAHQLGFGYKVTYTDDTTKNKKHVEIFESSALPQKTKISNYVWSSQADTLMFQRNQLVQNVVTELVNVNTKKKIEDRLTVKQLDKMISEEFQNSGIDTKYFFAVNKIEGDSLTLIKPGADTISLKKSNFRTLLFPAELFFNPNQLIVYFPDQETYLLGSISGMLGLSIGLILIITAVFYNTLRMFVRQKKLTEIKNDLINNITHEFKTPISTISLACEALKEPDLMKESTSVNRYAAIIKEENERLRMMVENILNAAAMEKESFHLSKDEADIDDIIRKSVEKFEETIKQKNGGIDIIGIPSGIILNADKFHLINIISNLIDNAIKYNENNPEIKIVVRKEPGNAVIEISDNGIGIDKNHIEKIFGTFYRVPTGNIHNVRGNGIGLSYAKKIIEAHGGSISVKSQPGNGSLFEIKLKIS